MKPTLLLPSIVFCLAACPAFANSSPASLTITMNPVQLPLPGGPPEMDGPSVTCEIKPSAESDKTIGELWAKEAPVFAFKDWQYVIPDGAFHTITMSSQGKTLILRSAHVAFEENPETVALSTGITSLGGKTRDAAKQGDDQAFVAKKKAFDRLMKACTAWATSHAK